MRSVPARTELGSLDHSVEVTEPPNLLSVAVIKTDEKQIGEERAYFCF